MPLHLRPKTALLASFLASSIFAASATASVSSSASPAFVSSSVRTAARPPTTPSAASSSLSSSLSSSPSSSSSSSSPRPPLSSPSHYALVDPAAYRIKCPALMTTTTTTTMAAEKFVVPLSSSSSSSSSRKSFLSSCASIMSFACVGTASYTIVYADPARAEDGSPSSSSSISSYSSLEESLYLILRAREAAAQETRLIKSGRFKDVQRANVKLAVKFIVNNYRLSDNFIAAAGTLTGNRRVSAGEVGQSVVQNLYTILEYFDSSDVENIKVGAMSMAGKETIVLSGLEAARNGIDEYLSYFPSDVVDAVKARIQKENELNVKEFDTTLGTIINPDPKL